MISLQLGLCLKTVGTRTSSSPLLRVCLCFQVNLTDEENEIKDIVRRWFADPIYEKFLNDKFVTSLISSEILDQ